MIVKLQTMICPIISIQKIILSKGVIMDNDDIKKKWEKLIPTEESDGGKTYRNDNWLMDTPPTLPMLHISQIETLDMANPTEFTVGSSNSDEFTMSSEPSGANNIESMNTVVCEESLEKIKNNESVGNSSNEFTMKTDVDDISNMATIKTVSSEEFTRTNIVNNHYEVLSEIARGGMGVVFKGCQSSLQREIAIKKIINDNEVNRSKFLCESIVTAHLDHPNIVPVHELAENEDGEAFLAMKLVAGHEWKKLLYPKKSSEIELAKKYDLQAHLQVLLNVCNAVAYAHSKEIAHCDLKPSNVMVGEFGEVLVMDWGIAVDIGAEKRGLTIHKSMVDAPMGTPYYMPGELASGSGDEIGPWTDVYLLGGILYELLMRKPPHKGNTMTAIFAAIMGKQPEFSKNIPEELKEICLKALAKDTSARYQSVAKFSIAIKEYMKHRESLLISQQAQTTLLSCLESDLKTHDANFLYSEYAQAVSGFEQALKLWDANKDALYGKEKAKFAYAEMALKEGDFGLAEAQLNMLVEDAKVIALKAKIKKTKNSKLRVQKTATRLKRIVYIAIFLIITGLGIGFFLVSNAYREANAQRNFAKEQKNLAEKNEKKAQNARLEAEAKSEQLATEKQIVQKQKDEITTKVKRLFKQKNKIQKQHSLLLKRGKEIFRKNAVLTKQKNKIKKQKELAEEQNEALKIQRDEIQKQNIAIENEKRSAVEASRIALRTLHKIFFEVDGAQKDPSIIQSVKGIFQEMKRLNMLETILIDEEDSSWLYGIVYGETQTYSDLIKREPNNYSAYYNRGNIFIENGLYDKAIQDFSKAIELNPELAEAYFNRGIIHLKRKNYNEASYDFSKSIEFDSNNAQYLYYYAYLLLKLEKYDEAEKHLLRSIQLDNNFASAHEKLGRVYFQKEQYQKCILSLKNAIAKKSTKNAHYYLARAFSIIGKKERAMYHLKAAIKNKFNNWDDIKSNPDFDNIRNEKKFQKLLHSFSED